MFNNGQLGERVCVSVCLGVGGRCDIFNVGVGVTRWLGIDLAVNGETVEGRNMTNDSTLNRSQKREFYVLLRFTLVVCLYFCYVELSYCPLCGVQVAK